MAASSIVGVLAAGALTLALTSLSPLTVQASHTLAAERTQDLALMLQAQTVEPPLFEVAPSTLMPLTARTESLSATAVPATCRLDC